MQIRPSIRPDGKLQRGNVQRNSKDHSATLAMVRQRQHARTNQRCNQTLCLVRRQDRHRNTQDVLEKATKQAILQWRKPALSIVNNDVHAKIGPRLVLRMPLIHRIEGLAGRTCTCNENNARHVAGYTHEQLYSQRVQSSRNQRQKLFRCARRHTSKNAVGDTRKQMVGKNEEKHVIKHDDDGGLHVER